jgi:hypothetical protein
MERVSKRIRVSLEPHAEKKIYDTSAEGQETEIV